MTSSSSKESNEMGFHIYNVTIKVGHSIHDVWLEWMKNKHIPEVMNTGCFLRFQLVRLLETEEADGVTYAIQYYSSDLAGYKSFIQQYEPSLRRDAIAKWGNNFIEFGSIMEVVH